MMTRRNILGISLAWVMGAIGLRPSSASAAAPEGYAEFRILCSGNEHVGPDRFKADWLSWQNREKQDALLNKYIQSGKLLSVKRDFRSHPRQWVMVFRDSDSCLSWRKDCGAHLTWDVKKAQSLGYKLDFVVIDRTAHS